MLQNLKTPQALAEEFLGLRKQVKPLEARQDELKVALRAFGPETYDFQDAGKVVVSKPGESRLTGQKLVVNELLIDKVDPAVLKPLFESGFLAWEEQWSRATASKVEAKFDG